MRVKTPWIEALNKSREQPQPGQEEAPRAKPDLTPKRMADSYYSAVRILTLLHSK
jgi:acyl-coenzyme A thioesterase 9